MDNIQWLPVMGGVGVGALVGAAAAFAWLASQLRRERDRVNHVEQARQLSAQQVTQARKQIEQLQRENHELRLVVRPAPRPAPAPEPAVDPAEAARLYAESKMQPAAPKPENSGFRDTVVLRRGE